MASLRVLGPQQLAATLSVALLLPAPAMAADLAGQCCADLEERIAELEATTARKGNRKVKLEISGHINEALMWWHDGDDSGTVSPFASEDSNVYQGTNDVSRTRFRFKGDAKVGDGWKAGYLIEIGIRANRLSRTDEFTDEGGTEVEVRHSTWFIEQEKLGKLGVGLTSQASDGITELNSANLGHFVRMSASKWNLNNHVIVGGVRSTNRRWRDLLPTDGVNGDGVPGEGDRRNLVRYDSPKWQGFQISGAWGEDDFWDVALRYAGEIAGFKVVAGAGYAHYTDDNFDPETGADASIRGCASADPDPIAANDPGANGGKDQDCDTFGLSASVMHEASGLFVTGGYGIKSDELRDDIFANRAPGGIFGIEDEDWFWSVIAGIEKKWIDLGKTTFYGEFAHFEAGAQIGDTAGDIRTFDSAFPSLGPGDNFSRSSEVEYWGIGVNQSIEKAGMDLYIGYRHYEGEVTLSDTTNTGARQTFSIEDLDLVMSGAKVQF